jgi:hypothetical protein
MENISANPAKILKTYLKYIDIRKIQVLYCREVVATCKRQAAKSNCRKSVQNFIRKKRKHHGRQKENFPGK